MRNLYLRLYICATLLSITFLCVKWWSLSGFAMSCKYYSAAWGPNGDTNAVHVTVRNNAGRPLAGRVIAVVSNSGVLSATTDQKGEAVIHSPEGELVGLLIADVEIINCQGPMLIRKALDLGNGLDVWATEKMNPRANQ